RLQLDGRATEGADSHDRAHRGGLVPHKKHHRSSRDALIWCGPRVAEVPPDIDEPQPRLGTNNIFPYELQDGRYHAPEFFMLSGSNARRQLAAVAHEAKDR